MTDQLLEHCLETRLGALKEVSNNIHNRLERLINLEGERRYFHTFDILKIHQELIADVLSMSLYLSKDKSKLVIFIIHSITSSLQMPSDAQIDLRECYFNIQSLEIARQSVNYHVINKLEKVVIKDTYLNIPYFK